jgi:hypothetical protein
MCVFYLWGALGVVHRKLFSDNKTHAGFDGV